VATLKVTPAIMASFAGMTVFMQNRPGPVWLSCALKSTAPALGRYQSSWMFGITGAADGAGFEALAGGAGSAVGAGAEVGLGR
jgi:hypothetical protein